MLIKGSTGPKVAALVGQHNLPYYWALEIRDSKVIKSAVMAVCAEGGAPSEAEGIAAS